MNDLKFAFRQLLKNPIITCTAILTLALGIGANTAIFSVMNALMLRMLPVVDPPRLVLFGNGDSMGSTDGFPNGSTTLFSYYKRTSLPPPANCYFGDGTFWDASARK